MTTTTPTDFITTRTQALQRLAAWGAAFDPAESYGIDMYGLSYTELPMVIQALIVALGTLSDAAWERFIFDIDNSIDGFVNLECLERGLPDAQTPPESIAYASFANGGPEEFWAEDAWGWHQLPAYFCQLLSLDHTPPERIESPSDRIKTPPKESDYIRSLLATSAMGSKNRADLAFANLTKLMFRLEDAVFETKGADFNIEIGIGPDNDAVYMLNWYLPGSKSRAAYIKAYHDRCYAMFYDLEGNYGHQIESFNPADCDMTQITHHLLQSYGLR